MHHQTRFSEGNSSMMKTPAVFALFVFMLLPGPAEGYNAYNLLLKMEGLGRKETDPCPEKWVLFEDMCYRFYDSITATANGAHHLCRSAKAEAISITNKAIDDFLSYYLKKTSEKLTWWTSGREIAYTIFGSEKKMWVWLKSYKDQSLSYENWNTQPLDDPLCHKQNCGCLMLKSKLQNSDTLLDNYVWMRSSCNISGSVACQKKPCPLGWTANGDHCYQAFYEHADHKTAKDYCFNYSAGLLTLNSDAQFSWIQTFLLQQPPEFHYWWTNSGSYVISLTAFNSFRVRLVFRNSSAWLLKKPPILDSDKKIRYPFPCITLQNVLSSPQLDPPKTTVDYGLADVPCHMELPFICQMEVNT